MIRANLTLVPNPVADLCDAVPALSVRQARAKTHSPKAPEIKTVPPPAAVPAWARASGRAGESEPLFFAGASLALLDACLRRDPPAAGALRSRLALHGAAASAKILSLNADQGALRDLRFALGDAGPAARLLALWQDLAARPPSLDSVRLTAAAARLDLALTDTDDLASRLKACAGQGDPVSAAPRRPH